MSFYQYHYDAEIFKKLPFIGELCSHVYKNSKGDFKKGFLCKVTETDYHKIKAQLKGDDKSSIVAKDKVYVLPKCSIPVFKLKEYLKSVGATQVSDIKEATKIIGHGEIFSGDKYTNSSLLVYMSRHYSLSTLRVSVNDSKAWSVGITSTVRKKTLTELIEFIDRIKTPEVEEEPSRTIIDYMFFSDIGYNDVTHTDMHFITPTCAMILYYKMLNKIPVVNEDKVFKDISKPLTIDKDIYKTLKSMLASADESNHITAIEIISNSDIDSSYYYLWKLAKDFSYVLSGYRRNKNFRLFKEKIQFHMLMCRSEKTIIPYLEEKGCLTAEIYKELMVKVIKGYKQMNVTELFDITLVPSEKYKKYDPEATWTIVAPKVREEELTS